MDKTLIVHDYMCVQSNFEVISPYRKRELSLVVKRYIRVHDGIKSHTSYWQYHIRSLPSQINEVVESDKMI